MTEPSTAYEVWVLGLRKWQKNPSADLSQLPRLTADSLPPSAYSRLLTHLHTAIEAMMQDFSEKFSRGIEHARSEHEMAQVMVGLRALLYRRVELARHPSLPEEISRPLVEAARREIAALQVDLERVLTSSTDRSSSNRSRVERMLKLARDNSFTAVLDPGFGHHGGGIPTGDIPAQPAAVRHSGSPVRRRILLPDASPPPQ